METFIIVVSRPHAMPPFGPLNSMKSQTSAPTVTPLAVVGGLPLWETERNAIPPADWAIAQEDC